MPYLDRLRDRTSYDTFGRVWTSTAPSAESRFAFTGRDFDPESELYHYRARYYDPVTGQFISGDPIGFEASDGNLYRYVGNGPTDGTDPSGLEEPSIENYLSLPEYREREAGSLVYQLWRILLRRGAMGTTPLFNMTNRVSPYFPIDLVDDGTMKKKSKLNRRDGLVALALANSAELSSDVALDGHRWHKIEFSSWRDAFGYLPDEDWFRYTEGWGGFLISTPHALEVAGTYEIRIDNVSRVDTRDGPLYKYQATLRNADLHWRVRDDVDANALREYNFKENSKAWGAIETLIADPFCDKLLSASYRVRVFFRQQVEEEWKAYSSLAGERFAPGTFPIDPLNTGGQPRY